jgi:hypothetical protein
MKKNIVTLAFLGLMITAAVFGVITYNKLEKQKIRNQDLVLELKQKEATNKQLKEQADKITAKLLNSNNNTTDPKMSTEKKILIEELKTVNENYTKVNDLSSYQKAYIFEKEGFEALIKNDFELAAAKIDLAEKASSGFHMCYEISALLQSKKKEWNNPEIQLYIKKQIIEKYSWRAPIDPIKSLQNQVKSGLSKREYP